MTSCLTTHTCLKVVAIPREATADYVTFMETHGNKFSNGYDQFTYENKNYSGQADTNFRHIVNTLLTRNSMEVTLATLNTLGGDSLEGKIIKGKILSHIPLQGSHRGDSRGMNYTALRATIVDIDASLGTRLATA